MRVPITKLRQDLFKVADSALQGELVEFTYKGIVFKIVPEKQASKLSKLIGQKVVAGGVDFEDASRGLLNEMEAAWEEDWSQL